MLKRSVFLMPFGVIGYISIATFVPAIRCKPKVSCKGFSTALQLTFGLSASIRQPLSEGITIELYPKNCLPRITAIHL